MDRINQVEERTLVIKGKIKELLHSDSNKEKTPMNTRFNVSGIRLKDQFIKMW